MCWVVTFEKWMLLLDKDSDRSRSTFSALVVAVPFASEEQQLVDGFLDGFSAAYLTVDFGQGPLDFLIDTGFNGALVVGEEFFDPTNAVSAGIVHADLATEDQYAYPTFMVQFAWFGEIIEVRVMIGPGTTCLLGVALFDERRLEIDYVAKTVRVI